MSSVALLTDMKDSRRVQDRQAFASKIRKDLASINDRHQDDLVAPFEFQKSFDEIGAILEPDGQIADILVDLWYALHPAEVRFALAFGELDVVPEGTKSVRHFDGPALHEAGELLDAMAREGFRVRFRLPGENMQDERLSALASLLYANLLGWTEHQLEVFRAYDRMGNQVDVADLFDVTQPTISEMLGKMRAKLFEEAMEVFRNELHQSLAVRD